MTDAEVRRSSAVRPPDPQRPWTAEIVWSTEDGEASFRVTASAAGEDEVVALAASRPLAWPPPDAAAVEQLRVTVERLEDALLASGWTPQPPGEAWYAKRFAWAEAAEPAAPPQRTGRFRRAVEWPEDTEQLWRCEIRWRPGYVTARFEAVAFEPGRDRGAAIGYSEPFKWLFMADPSPTDAAHVTEVRRIGERLVAAGWEPAGRGRHWYALRFLWRHDDPPEPLAVREPQESERPR